MKLFKSLTKKNAAQAMVEFAIALPVLLMLLYGLLEAGRFLFLYSTVVTASRQAVRYGSATGVGMDGLSPRYQDCDGIRDAATRVAYLGPFDQIAIAYDLGPPPPSPTPYCNSLSVDPSLSSSMVLDNRHRVIVTVTKEFVPLVPKLVPFIQRTITATSARTILASVSIEVTAPPQGFPGTGSGILSLSVSANPTTYSTVGQIITFTYTLSNTGTGDLSSPFAVNDSIAATSCASAPSTLAPGGSFTCTGTYQITQADLDAGSVTSQATATSASSTSSQVDTTVTAVQSPALGLTKSPSISASSIPGTVITYTYTLTNTGNVTLSSPYSVSDSVLNQVSCPATSPLAPGATTTCTATHTIRPPDITAGKIVNVATADARFGAQTITSNQATATVYTPPIFLTVTASPLSVNQLNQVITYTYRLTNNTAAPMTSPYTVNDDRATNENCSGATSPLPAGASTTCTGSYTVTQADLDAGLPLVSNITAQAKQQPGNKTVTSNQVTISIAVAQSPALSLQVSVSPTEATTLNTVVTYTYTLTNSGNVTLSPAFTVTDNKAGNITCANPAATLPPAATKTCTGTRTISQTDLDDGSVINQATASAVFGMQTITSNQQSVTVITYNAPRLSLLKTPNPASVTGIGQIITYTYTLRNTGNTPLTAPYTLTDNKIGNVDCSFAAGTLAIGASTACAGTYITVQADVTAGSIVNQATATATNGALIVTSNPATATVTVLP